MRPMVVEVLHVHGYRHLVTQGSFNTFEDALACACQYHGKLNRPWVFDAETGEVLYRWEASSEAKIP